MSLYLEHITQRFGQTLALNDIDLEIRNGEFLAILGPSGCGKSTVLRSLDRMHEIIPGAHCEGEVQRPLFCGRSADLQNLQRERYGWMM